MFNSLQLSLLLSQISAAWLVLFSPFTYSHHSMEECIEGLLGCFYFTFHLELSQSEWYRQLWSCNNYILPNYIFIGCNHDNPWKPQAIKFKSSGRDNTIYYISLGLHLASFFHRACEHTHQFPFPALWVVQCVSPYWCMLCLTSSTPPTTRDRNSYSSMGIRLNDWMTISYPTDVSATWL